MNVWSLGFSVKIVLLSQAIGSVSNGNLSVFDIISSKGREILGDDIVWKRGVTRDNTVNFFVTKLPSRFTQLIIVVILSNFGILIS